MKKRRHLSFLLLIMILGFVLRVSYLNKYPSGISWDEVSHGYNAYSILKTGSDEWGKFLPLSNFRAYGDYPLTLNLYLTIPSIKAKDDFVVNLTKVVFDPTFKVDSLENVQKFVQDLIGFYVIMEGIFFYAGFAMMLALKRRNKMIGIGEQFEFIMRDESVHLAFGCDLISNIIQENPGVWSPDFQDNTISLIKQAVELEKDYANDACPNGLLGINAEQFCNYVEYIADRRLIRLGLPKQYETENPFLWMSKATDLTKEKNFFETTVTEYKSGGLKW